MHKFYWLLAAAFLSIPSIGRADIPRQPNPLYCGDGVASKSADGTSFCSYYNANHRLVSSTASTKDGRVLDFYTTHQDERVLGDVVCTSEYGVYLENGVEFLVNEFRQCRSFKNAIPAATGGLISWRSGAKEFDFFVDNFHGPAPYQADVGAFYYDGVSEQPTKVCGIYDMRAKTYSIDPWNFGLRANFTDELAKAGIFNDIIANGMGFTTQVRREYSDGSKLAGLLGIITGGFCFSASEIHPEEFPPNIGVPLAVTKLALFGACLFSGYLTAIAPDYYSVPSGPSIGGGSSGTTGGEGGPTSSDGTGGRSGTPVTCYTYKDGVKVPAKCQDTEDKSKK